MKLKFPLWNFFRFLNLLIILSIFFKSSLAQQTKPKYNLLWQISGKGLSKPSFLFGSMHVRDKRAFNFSDSVMKAIENTSAFILEVHPDSLLQSIFGLSAQPAMQKRMKNLLSAEQKSELIKRFQAKNGYKPDSAQLDNPVLITSLMTPDYAKKDDKQTFIDAYLYGIAKTMRKKIFGLEKPSDQVDIMYQKDDRILGLFDKDEDFELENLDKMVAIYEGGNLEEITALLNEGDEDNLNLFKRNKIMADGIDSLLKSESVFVTIGAAHMLGESGVINLLRKLGYQLHKVKADFTGVANNYKIDHSKMSWTKYLNSDDNYEVEFPSKPFEIKKMMKKSVVFSDLTNDAIYTANSNYIGPIKGLKPQAYLDTLFKNYLGDGREVISKKSENRYGAASIDADIKASGKFIRLVLVLKNNTLYGLSVENEVNDVHEPYADRFFNSLKINDPTLAKNVSWIDYKNEKGGFSLKVPKMPDEVIKEVLDPSYPDHPYVMNIYTIVDKIKLNSFLFKYNDFPDGMYVSDKNSVFNGLIKQFENKGTITAAPKIIFNNGYEGRGLDINIQGYDMRLQFFLRGNRTYMLLKQNLSDDKTIADDSFFSSFKIENYLDGKSELFDIEQMSVKTPTKPQLILDKDEYDSETFLVNSKAYFAGNVNTGGLYMMETAHLSKYYKSGNVDSLYDAMIESISINKDSLLKHENVLVGDTKGKIYHFKDTLSGNNRKIKMWLNGDNFFYQSLIGTKEEIEGKQANEFFSTAIQTSTSQPFDIKSSKAKILLQDLTNKDSTIFNSAFGALKFYVFDESEIPLIKAALKLKYPSDSIFNGVRAKLIDVLGNLDKKNSVPFLMGLFSDIKNADLIRSKALVKVVKIDSTKYDWYIKSLLDSKPLNLDNYWMTFSPLTDSLAYAAQHFDKLLLLKKQPQYKGNIIDLIADISVSSKNQEYMSIINANKKEIFSTATEDLNKYLEDEDRNYAMEIYGYLKIFPVTDLSKLADEFTIKLVTDSNSYMKTTALVTRIKMNLPVEQSLLDTQLDSLSTRLDILTAYNSIGKLETVPAKYRSHDEIAEVILYHYLGDEDYPEDLKLLGKVVTEKGNYYAFDFSYADDEGSSRHYIAICGAFDGENIKKSFDEYFCHTEYELLIKDWQTQARKLIDSLDQTK
ncbi:TraB/GumN family protein [Pedobacter sp. Leaf250]|uniref:TraB/GumN family protein n=1 Tax=Pedobacter sp. Leaf250 TaxID=2876559 RepID=UPI001E61CEBA|nr:TraB/GumN family protein [Pedobacter sp. Leaf250]